MEVEAVALEAKEPAGPGLEIGQSGEAASEARRGPKSCSSHFKGVTKHRRTGRWEAHIWGRAANKGPGKQIYLGGFVTPEEAAEAHDLAALQLQGTAAKTNFHVSRYTGWLATLQAAPPDEDLPRQLRKAMYKRCSEKPRSKGGEESGGAQPRQRKREREPPSPFKSDPKAKARASLVSDSTQSVDTGPSNHRGTVCEESVTSQASKRAKDMAAPGTLPHIPTLTSVSIVAPGKEGEPATGVPAQTFTGYPIGPIPGVPYLNGMPLVNMALPQLPPLQWGNFELNAQALYPQPMGPPPAPAPAAQTAPGSIPPESAAVSSLPASLPPPINPGSNELLPGQGSQPPGMEQSAPTQVVDQGQGSWVNPSWDGGVMYGNNNLMGYLTPEQVRWLEAGGVKFPDPQQQATTAAALKAIPALEGAPPPSSQQPFPRLQIDQLQPSAGLSSQPISPSFASAVQPPSAGFPPSIAPVIPPPGAGDLPYPAAMDGQSQPPPPASKPQPLDQPILSEPGNQGLSSTEEVTTKEPGVPETGSAEGGTPRVRSANDQQIAEALLGLKTTSD